MTYKDKFVVVVKHNGRIMREIGDVVTLPFGSEYSLLFKNLESRKAIVDVSIDGEDVLSGQQLIVEPNDTTELKGFLKGTKARNRFRFIKKTKRISNYRGDRIDDGLIRVEFTFEQKPKISWDINWPVVYRNDSKDDDFYIGSPTFGDSTGGYPRATNITTTNGMHSVNFCSSTNKCKSMDEGITVKGSEINQGFIYGNVGALESYSSVIVLKLRGKTKTKSGKIKKVKKAISVKTRLTCPTCGRKWKSSMKYCGGCSTYLR